MSSIDCPFHSSSLDMGNSTFKETASVIRISPFRFLTILRGVALVALVCSTTIVAAGPLQLGETGVTIDGGSMGTFTLPYPQLATNSAAGKPETPVQKRVMGNKATLSYPCGVSVEISIGSDKKVTYRFSGRQEVIENFRVGELLIPPNYMDGGKWRIGAGDMKPFPAEKPDSPFLFQGNATAFEFSGVDGKRIRIDLPPYSFQQLQDNREWNWKTFAWWFHTPFDQNRAEYVVTVTLDNNDGKNVVLVDRFGQTTRKEFFGKVVAPDELKHDVDEENAYYASLTPAHRDSFGGLSDSGEKLSLRKTGFFHVERNDDRWLLVDPAGNAFFHLGICSFGCGEDYTYVEGRESIYEWLPPRNGDFSAAWHPESWWNPRAFSFYKANLIRKYGTFDEEAFQTRMVRRVRQAGFNSVGAFSATSPVYRQEHFPFVASLPLAEWLLGPSIPGVRGIFDPFDDGLLAKMNTLFAEALPKLADEPLLIGYFLANEQAFDDLPRAIPRLDGKHACKRRLIVMLREKYDNIAAFNSAWKMDAASFDTLADRGLPVITQAAFQDMQAFTGLFIETYYRRITENFRKHDRNHMLIGNRWQPGTANNEALCRIAGKYMDIISVNYYTEHVDPQFVRRIYEWSGQRPQIWSEFFYTAEAESNVTGRHDLPTQRERGLAYRNYVETAASLGFVVGTEWFTLIDQAVSGRFFEKYNGERQNTGLFNVCDRPYRDALAEMSATHRRVYDVSLSGEAPYSFEHPRFTGGQGATVRTVRAGHAVGPIAVDAQLTGWPGRPPERIASDRLTVGRDSKGVEATFKVCWDEKALYLLADVTDPTPMQNQHSGPDLWSADGLELFIGSEAIDQAGPLRFTDRQILIGAGNTADGKQSHVVNAPTQPKIKRAVVLNTAGNGYTLEVAVPWSAVGIQPKEGLELLFDLAVDDSADGQSRNSQLMWNGSDRNSADRGGWGRLILER